MSEAEQFFIKHDKKIDFDLDLLLPQIGDFGLYQKLLIWLICLPSCIPCGFGAFNQLFMMEVPDHWCKMNEILYLQNYTAYERKLFSIPREDNKSYSHCSRYVIPWDSVLTQDSLPTEPDIDWPLESCVDGWEYDTSVIESSIVIDFDLVCDYAIYPTIGLAALNIGGPIGVYIFGILNDKIGRKKTFFLCLITLLTGSFMTALAHKYWVWALSRAIVGLTIPAIYQIPFIIALELVGANYRSFVTVMTCMAYTFGLILLAGVSYYIREWRKLALTTSVPFILYFLYWFVLPESPRWLLLQERYEEANKIIESIAKLNGKTVPKEFTEALNEQVRVNKLNASVKKGKSIFTLCQTPNLRLKTILITLNWCASEMVYVGLSYYGPAIGDNQYMSFFLSSVVELPSYVVSWYAMDRWGRRWPLCLSMVISGIFCVITVTLPSGAVYTTLILFLISKLFISASFLIIYPYAGELYPTELRGIGIGTSAYVGGLGLIIIPFVNYLGAENLVLPLVIMGILSIIGGVTALRLPETLHCRLPQTAEEGESFGKDWSYKDCFTCIPTSTSASGMPGSYEDIDDEDMELHQIRYNINDIEVDSVIRRNSMRRIVRQSSVVDTQKDVDGSIKMTYWF